VIGQHWQAYKDAIDAGREAAEVLDELKVVRYCCRRMFVSHVDLIDDVAPSTVPHPP
jgi:DNA-directed RNA polymerase subunit N